MSGACTLGRHNCFLLDKADLGLKRELPVERWHLLRPSVHPMLPTRRIRRQPRWQRRLAKIHPIALPVPAIDTGALGHDAFPQKTVDGFFSGNVAENSLVGRSGMA